MNNPLVKKEVIKKIENLADEKAKDIQRNYYYKYNHFYKIVLTVLKRHDVLLYGGTAINELFPQKYKFYDKEELPDIDIYCTDYNAIANDIIKTFKQKGYHLTSVSEALHPNTYKIIIEGLQLIDLTVIDKRFFNNLKKGGYKTSLGIPTVNLDFLKYSLHTTLSQPLDSWRWTKVYQRMVRIYEVFPINIKCSLTISKYYVDIPSEQQDFVKNIITKYNLIAFGWDVIQTYLEEDETIPKTIKNSFIINNTTSKNLTPLQYLLVNKDSDKIVNFITKNSKLVIDHVFPGDEILPKYYCLKYENQKYIYLFESANCISYINLRKKMVLSIHSIISYLYMMYLSTQEVDIKCIIQVLTAIQMNNALSSKKIFQQFVLNCYGFQKGVVTLRKERYLRMKNKS